MAPTGRYAFNARFFRTEYLPFSGPLPWSKVSGRQPRLVARATGAATSVALILLIVREFWRQRLIAVLENDTTQAVE